MKTQSPVHGKSARKRAPPGVGDAMSFNTTTRQHLQSRLADKQSNEHA